MAAVKLNVLLLGGQNKDSYIFKLLRDSNKQPSRKQVSLAITLLKDSGSSKLIQSYCPVCGIFLAASPMLSILEFIEKMHRCSPPNYDSENLAGQGRCRITQYLPK
jgi:hypothetical protein